MHIMSAGLLAPGGILVCDNVLYRGLVAQHDAGEMPVVSEKTSANAAALKQFVDRVGQDRDSGHYHTCMSCDDLRMGSYRYHSPETGRVMCKLACANLLLERTVMTCVSFCSIKFSHLVAITMRLCVNPVWDVSAQFLGSFAVCLVTVFHPFCPFCIVVISLSVSFFGCQKKKKK